MTNPDPFSGWWLCRYDDHGRHWLYTNPSDALRVKVLREAFSYGYGVEWVKRSLPAREVGAA